MSVPHASDGTLVAAAANPGLRGDFEQAFERVLSLDLRSLAVFRVGLSLVLLYDLLDRSQSLVAHYTDLGVVPADRAVEMFGRGVYASIHFHFSGSPLAVGCLFALAAICGVAMLVGYRTRLATLLSWYLLASLQVRNDWANGMSGDEFLLSLLFWAIFLPLGARASIDARRRSDTQPGNRVFRVATAAYIVQILVVYLSTGLLKSGEAWSDGSAIHYALHLGHFATPFTPWLRELDWALPLLTHATLVFERVGPFLLFVPFYVAVARMLAVVLFTGFHIGLAVFLNVGPFPIICIVAWLALLPDAFFDRWLPRLRSSVPVSQGAASPLAPRQHGIARTLDLALLVPLLFVVIQAGVKLGWVDLGQGRALPPAAHRFGQLLRLNQNWGMFSPEPTRYTLWLGVEGRLASGESIDPFAGAPVRHSIPDDIAGASRNYRWRAYTWTALLTNPRRATLEVSHRDFAAFVCREWNASHSGGQRLVGLRSIGFWRETGPAGPADLEPTVLYEYQCHGEGRLLWSAAR